MNLQSDRTLCLNCCIIFTAIGLSMLKNDFAPLNIMSITLDHNSEVSFAEQFRRQTSQLVEPDWMLLMNAAQDGDASKVKNLLDNDIHADTRRNIGSWSALTRAAIRGHVEVVGMLLDAGADPNSFSSEDDPHITILSSLKDWEYWLPYCVTGYGIYEVDGDHGFFGEGEYDENTQHERATELKRMKAHTKHNISEVRRLLIEKGGRD
jgi:hypothetical protein